MFGKENAERRLLGFGVGKFSNTPDLNQLATTVRAREHIEGNKDIMTALSAINTPALRQAFPFLDDPFHREMFHAWFLDQAIVRDKKNPTASPKYKSVTAFPAGAAGPIAPNQIDMNILTNANALLQRYQDATMALNTLLNDAEVPFSTTTEKEMDLRDGTKLTRNEYFSLLQLQLDPAQAATVKRLVESKLPGIRSGLKRSSKVTERGLRIYADLSHEALPAMTAANRFNLIIGQDLMADYVQFRSGIKTPGRPDIPTESAETWQTYPERAYEFLNGSAAFTAQNREFMYALRYHLIEDDAMRAQLDATAGKPKLSIDDTRAALNTVIAALAEKQGIVSNSYKQKAELSKGLGLDKTIEGFAGDAWEYIKNFEDHKIGSFIAAGAAFFALRHVYKLFTKEKWSAFNYLELTAAGALGINMFMKHQYGYSIVDKITEKYGDVMPFDPSLPREHQTLANYWGPKLNNDREMVSPQLNDTLRMKSLAMLQSQNAEQTLQWYEAMEEWKNSGGVASRQPSMPFSLPNKSAVFGEATSTREVGGFLYETLHNFFYHVGESEGAKNTFGSRTFRGNADRGIAFIRARYDRRGDHDLVSASSEPYYQDSVQVTIDGRAVTVNLQDPNDVNLQLVRKRAPELYGQLMLGRMMLKTYDFSKVDMWTIFLFEADPAAIAEMGDEDLSGLLADMQQSIASVVAPGASAAPTGSPAAPASAGPSATPTGTPSSVPVGAPSARPSGSPSPAPSGSPTPVTGAPSSAPTGSPSAAPSGSPTPVTGSPAAAPTGAPSAAPTGSPAPITGSPSAAPIGAPAATPGASPSTVTGAPATTPTGAPTPLPGSPSAAPAATSSGAPIGAPSASPTGAPGTTPSATGSMTPTGSPSVLGTPGASTAPTGSPIPREEGAPTEAPGGKPADSPTGSQSPLPSAEPTPKDGKQADAPKGTAADDPKAAPAEKKK